MNYFLKILLRAAPPPILHSNTLGLGFTTGILNISLIQRDKNSFGLDKTNLSSHYMAVDLLVSFWE